MHVRHTVRLLLVEGFIVVALLVAVSSMPGIAGAAAGPASGAVEGSDGHVVRPVSGAVLRAFDPPATPYGAGHRGIDLDALPGERVVAAMGGTVTFAGRVAGTSWVTVRHGAGLDTTYGSIDPRVVTAGARVDAGETLGYLSTEAAHLDWGLRRHGEYLDPLSLLGRWRVRLAPLR